MNGSLMTLTGVGSISITASEAAAENYATATQTTTFSVTATGAVWLGNANGTQSTFSLGGVALSPSAGFRGGGLGTAPSLLGMAFDATGDLWIANRADGVSEIWIANGNGSVSALTNTGTPLSPTTCFTGLRLATPGGIAIQLSAVPGPALPFGATLPFAKINTSAYILEICIDSACAAWPLPLAADAGQRAEDDRTIRGVGLFARFGACTQWREPRRERCSTA